MHEQRIAVTSISGMKSAFCLNEIDFLVFVMFSPYRTLCESLNKIRRIFMPLRNEMRSGI